MLRHMLWWIQLRWLFRAISPAPKCVQHREIAILAKIDRTSAPPSVQRDMAFSYSSGRWESRGLGVEDPQDIVGLICGLELMCWSAATWRWTANWWCSTRGIITRSIIIFHVFHATFFQSSRNNSFSRFFSRGQWNFHHIEWFNI